MRTQSPPIHNYAIEFSPGETACIRRVKGMYGVHDGCRLHSVHTEHLSQGFGINICIGKHLIYVVNSSTVGDRNLINLKFNMQILNYKLINFTSLDFPLEEFAFLFRINESLLKRKQISTS
jgi:hypothetical protein